MGPSNNPPRKHHFVPEFLLRQWAVDDGELCEYRRFGNRIASGSKSPGATGYQIDLYKLDGAPPDVAQRFEQAFMAPVDGAASDALHRLLAGSNGAWAAQLASSWVRFVLSLRYRHPQAVAEIKAMMAEAWKAAKDELATSYEAVKLPGDPPTLEQYLAKRPPGSDARPGLDMLWRVIDSQRNGRTLIQSHWRVVDLSQSPIPLLLSDRAVQVPLGFGDENGFLLLPISPKKLFVFDRGVLWEDLGSRVSAEELVEAINLETVQRAHEFVWGTSDRHHAFVQAHMGAKPVPPLVSEALRLDVIAAARGASRAKPRAA